LGILKLSKDNAQKLKEGLSGKESWSAWYTIPLVGIVNQGGFYNLVLPDSLKFCFDVDNNDDYSKLQNLNKELKAKQYKKEEKSNCTRMTERTSWSRVAITKLVILWYWMF